MAKNVQAPAADEAATPEQNRKLLLDRYSALAASGIRLSADKAWLRPAVESAVHTKVEKATDALTDEQVLVVLTFSKAAL